jgi:hypothetical protein
MADEPTPLDHEAGRSLASQMDGWRDRLLMGMDARWQELAQKWEAIFAREQRRFERIGVDAGDEAAALDAYLGAYVDKFAEALQGMREDREWRDVETSPDYQAWERERERSDAAADRAADPDYQGWLAEQQWNEEQGEPFDYSYEAFLAAGRDHDPGIEVWPPLAPEEAIAAPQLWREGQDHDEDLLYEDWANPGRYYGRRNDSELGPPLGSREAAETDADFAEHQARTEGAETGYGPETMDNLEGYVLPGTQIEQADSLAQRLETLRQQLDPPPQESQHDRGMGW